MTTTTLQANNTTSNKRLIALFVMLMLSCVGMFGQELNNASAPAVTSQMVSSASNTDSQMELISWFMGSKQIQLSNAVKSSNTISTNNSGKKQFINCGMTPNRILSRAFMKKAVNYDKTVA